MEDNYLGISVGTSGDESSASVFITSQHRRRDQVGKPDQAEREEDSGGEETAPRNASLGYPGPRVVGELRLVWRDWMSPNTGSFGREPRHFLSHSGVWTSIFPYEATSHPSHYAVSLARDNAWVKTRGWDGSRDHVASLSSQSSPKLSSFLYLPSPFPCSARFCERSRMCFPLQ